MPYCENCGTQIDHNCKFCPNCGEKNSKTNDRSENTTYMECPRCGDSIPAFSIKCPSCNMEISNRKATFSVQILNEQLSEIESRRRKSNLFDSITTKMFGREMDVVDQQKIELIRNYPIPNTKEDIQEFLILSSANMDLCLESLSDDRKNAEIAIADAWKMKYEQAYQKAKILLKNDADLKVIEENYYKKIQEPIEKEAERKEKEKKLSRNLMIVGIVTLCILFLLPSLFVLTEELSASPTAIEVGTSASEFYGKQYEEVVMNLNEKGFTNIQTIPVDDLIIGFLTSEGSVESITIDGEDNFSASDKFEPDVLIIITYHTFPE